MCIRDRSSSSLSKRSKSLSKLTERRASPDDESILFISECIKEGEGEICCCSVRVRVFFKLLKRYKNMKILSKYYEKDEDANINQYKHSGWEISFTQSASRGTCKFHYK